MTDRGLRKLAWFCRAWCVLVVVRCGLTFLSYSQVRTWLPLRRSLTEPPVEERSRCAWAIARASRWVPKATCLTQALSGQWLLARRGYASRVVIGVRRPSHGEVAAHAWLRVGEDGVLGATTEDLSAFTELTELGVPA